MIEAVVYTSQAGHTREYAQLLGGETGLPVYELKEARHSLKKGMPVIYMGWLMGGFVRGYGKAKHAFDVRAVCGIGMSPDDSQMNDVRRENRLPNELPCFILQGGFEFDRLHGVYRLMMKTVQGRIGKQVAAKKDRTPWEDEMLDLMQNGGNCVSKERLTPVIEWYRQNKKDEEKNMNVKYEHKPALTLIGFSTEIAPNEGYEKCPKFWNEAYSERYARLFATGEPQNAAERAVLDNRIGMFAICEENENGFAYWIAGEYRGGEVPEGFALYTFPESDWAVFTAKGPLPVSLQTLNTAVWQEWYPAEGQNYRPNGMATLEVYSAGDMQSPEYECGIWVPLLPARICQSCGMPIVSNDQLGTNTDGRVSRDYCKYCYDRGEFIDKVSMEEYIEMCAQYGAQAGMSNDEMRKHCQKLFPGLKRWKANT